MHQRSYTVYLEIYSSSEGMPSSSKLIFPFRRVRIRKVATKIKWLVPKMPQDPKPHKATEELCHGSWSVGQIIHLSVASLYMASSLSDSSLPPRHSPKQASSGLQSSPEPDQQCHDTRSLSLLIFARFYHSGCIQKQQPRSHLLLIPSLFVGGLLVNIRWIPSFWVSALSGAYICLVQKITHSAQTIHRAEDFLPAPIAALGPGDWSVRHPLLHCGRKRRWSHAPHKGQCPVIVFDPGGEAKGRCSMCSMGKKGHSFKLVVRTKHKFTLGIFELDQLVNHHLVYTQ